MRVAVTGTAEGAGRLARRLREEGVEAVECPLVGVEPIAGPPIDLSAYDWLVLTSAQAVAPLLARTSGGLPRIAAIGPGTAASLRERGLEPAVVAERSTQEGLVEALRRRLEPGERVLFAGAEGARGVLARELEADVVVLYRTVELRPREFPEADVVVLASASAARACAALGIGRPCVSIGPSTTAEAERLGLRVVAEAPTHDLDGLVAAVRRLVEA